MHQGNRLAEVALPDRPGEHLQRARRVRIRTLEQPLLQRERIAQTPLGVRKLAGFLLLIAQAVEAAGKRGVVSLVRRQRVLKRNSPAVCRFGGGILRSQREKVPGVTQGARELRRFRGHEHLPLGDRRLEQRLRLPVEPETHVHRSECVHECRLDLRLLRQLRVDPRSALVEHLTRSEAVTARLARVGNPEQVDEKYGRLARGFRLTLRNDGLPLCRGAGNESGGGESGRQHHAGDRPGSDREELPLPAALLALAQAVESHTQ